MKKTLLAVTLAALTSGAATSALAADPKAPEPDFEISGNFALVSDYRFRGISQTDKDPAAQGGFDVAHKSGLAAGVWASNVSDWAAPGGSQEIDVYASYSGSLPAEIGYEVGVVRYQYPGIAVAANAISNNTTEWFVGLSYGPLAYKYSKTTGTWFGVPESNGSQYHDLSVTFEPLEKVSLTLHAGLQDISGRQNNGAAGGDFSFKDYSLSLSYDLGDDFAASVSFTSVDFKEEATKAAWFTTIPAQGNTTLYNDAVFFTISKSF